MKTGELELGQVQEHFARLIWDNEPISSGELVKLCQRELNWKKPTTYTVLRKLCEKGLFENKDGVVTARISREEFAARRSQQFVESSFGGSLPAFVAAFTAHRALSPQEAEEIQRLIDGFRRGDSP